MDENRRGPVRTANCFIEVDILEKIKREARYKKVNFQILLNQILREAVFSDKKPKGAHPVHKVVLRGEKEKVQNISGRPSFWKKIKKMVLKK